MLHEVAKFRVPRRISGTYFERGGNNRVCVFPHTLWVGVGLDRESTLGLLGLLTSSPMNFVFHFCSTNNHVVMNLLACLPVPERVVSEVQHIAGLTEAALVCGGRLTALFEQVGVDRGRALRTGVPQLDPVTFLGRRRLPSVRLRTWVERGWLRLPENQSLLQWFSVAVLLERGRLKFEARAGVQQVIEIWVSAYGDKKWTSSEALPMPDDPLSFLEAWNATHNDLTAALDAHERSMSDIDDAVAQLYGVPENLRNVLRHGPPWLARRGMATAEENADSAET